MKGDANWALALHDGAGTMSRPQLAPEKETRYRTGLKTALATARAIMERRRTAVDAVEHTVTALEERLLFNAGNGSVLTAQVEVEMDAAIADCRPLDAGAVIGVRRLLNPVNLARLEGTRSVIAMALSGHQFRRLTVLECTAHRTVPAKNQRSQFLSTRQAGNRPTRIGLELSAKETA